MSQRSGVSVRASIASFETLEANAARRAITLGETHAVPRVCDLNHLIPALQGKLELETVDDDRDDQVIEKLIQGAVAAVFNRRFNVVDLEELVEQFKTGISVEIGEDMPANAYAGLLNQVETLGPGLQAFEVGEDNALIAAAIEFLLEGLHLNKRLNKDVVGGHIQYRG